MANSPIVYLITLGFSLNSILSEKEPFELSFSEVHDSLDNNSLLGLLADRTTIATYTGYQVLLTSKALDEVMSALAFESKHTRGDEKKYGLCSPDQGVGLVLALVLEATQTCAKALRN